MASGRRTPVPGPMAMLLPLLLAGVTFLTACDPGPPAPSPTTSASEPRPFTVMSTDPIRVTDPAAINDQGSAVIAMNVFQRLMTAPPGEALLKPDAARDCLFSAPNVYTCVLNKGLTFHNGDELTASDVKFSIARAARLAVPGSSASLLSSLRRIETPDPLTVSFVLSRADSQFGFALASPAASIVDEQLYDADQVRSPRDPIIGSGPYEVAALSDHELTLQRFDGYIGHDAARLPRIRYVSAADSAALEAAMSRHEVEVVWRGLSAAALIRYGSQINQSPDRRTADGYGLQTYPGLRVRELAWNPESDLRATTRLRQAIVAALQGDRTLDSIVPNGIPGHTPSFPLGGRAKPKVTWKNRIQLTLGYDATAPDGRDVATQVRTRLEDTGGLSVRLTGDLATADLQLLDRKAWTATAIAWLQPYLDAPLKKSAPTLGALVNQYRVTTDQPTALAALAALQRQAAVDLTVVPVSQGDESLLVAAGVAVEGRTFGPGWQLGLFGMGRV